MLKQRIVEMPYKEALKWENKGAFAATKEKFVVEITEIIFNRLLSFGSRNTNIYYYI